MLSQCVTAREACICVPIAALRMLNGTPVSCRTTAQLVNHAMYLAGSALETASEGPDVWFPAGIWSGRRATSAGAVLCDDASRRSRSH